jgi:hypothetical protein
MGQRESAERDQGRSKFHFGGKAGSDSTLMSRPLMVFDCDFCSPELNDNFAK